jgi:toxin-antitoxin system PIN domain toxin
MIYLADVNVWLAWTYPAHQHHSAAERWLADSTGDQIAFCRTTQNGLLRLLTSSRVMGADVFTAEDAWDVYDDFFKTGKVRFAEEPPGLERAWRQATQPPQTGPNFWTDAYLAAFAITAGYTVVTFDQG